MAAEAFADITMEQEFLGALIAAPELSRTVATGVRPDHFSEPAHARLFEAITSRSEDSAFATFTTIASYLKEEWNQPFVADKTLGAYVAALMANGAPPIVMQGYAADLKRLWALRSIHAAAVRPAGRDGSLKDHLAGTLDAIDQVRADIAEAAARRAHIGDSVESMMERVKRVKSGQEKVSGCTTGFPAVDRMMLGYRPGELIVVAGRPGMGKTSWATSSLLKSARAGHGCALFSLELPEEAIGARLLADFAYDTRRHITYSQIRKCELTDDEIWRLDECAADLRETPLEIDYSTGITVSEIGARVGNLKRRMALSGKDLGVICIDYLKFLKATDRYRGQRVYEVGEITSGLKAIAKDLNVCVILLAQLNRGVEGEKDKRPDLQHLRESGDIEADADVVMFMYRDEYYIERSTEFRAGNAEAMDRYDRARNKLELIIAKNRNGPTTTVELFCDIGCSAIRPLMTDYGR